AEDGIRDGHVTGVQTCALPIFRHGEHTHLAYFLELPKHEGPVERELNIKREASYIIAVKNLQTPSPPKVGLSPKQEADFPKELRSEERRVGKECRSGRSTSEYK